LHEEFKRRINTPVPCATNAAKLIWARFAAGQIAQRKGDGWERRAEKPSAQIIDLAAFRSHHAARSCLGNSDPNRARTGGPRQNFSGVDRQANMPQHEAVIDGNLGDPVE
jgi:hypothetical protein